MPRFEEAFNRSGFLRFLNSTAGRIFRVVAGLGFLVVGYVYRGMRSACCLWCEVFSR